MIMRTNGMKMRPKTFHAHAVCGFAFILPRFKWPAAVRAVAMSWKRKMLELATDDTGQLHADPRNDSRGQVGTVIAVVTIGIVAIIGILIYSQVNDSLPTPANSELANAQSNVTGGFGDAMQLVPVVLIVLVASLVIGVVQRFG